jgi:hypothetical protein
MSTPARLNIIRQMHHAILVLTSNYSSNKSFSIPVNASLSKSGNPRGLDTNEPNNNTAYLLISTFLVCIYAEAIPIKP